MNEQNNIFLKIYNLFKDLLISILLFLISIFRDFHSFRNKLILISTILCFYTIYSSMSNEVIISVIAIWNIIIMYYFKKRQESTNNENK
jgi:hypothetical protein